MNNEKNTQTEKNIIQKINQMSRTDMAHAWRFVPAGDPLFLGKAGEVFEKRFRSLGGFSPEISKQIEW